MPSLSVSVLYLAKNIVEQRTQQQIQNKTLNLEVLHNFDACNNLLPLYLWFSVVKPYLKSSQNCASIRGRTRDSPLLCSKCKITVDDVQPDAGRSGVGRAAGVIPASLLGHLVQGQGGLKHGRPPPRPILAAFRRRLRQRSGLPLDRHQRRVHVLLRVGH